MDEKILELLERQNRGETLSFQEQSILDNALAGGSRTPTLGTFPDFLRQDFSGETMSRPFTSPTTLTGAVPQVEAPMLSGYGWGRQTPLVDTSDTQEKLSVAAAQSLAGEPIDPFQVKGFDPKAVLAGLPNMTGESLREAIGKPAAESDLDAFIKQHAGEVLTPEQEQELLRLQQAADTQDTVATDTDPRGRGKGKRDRKRLRDMSDEEKDDYFKQLAFLSTVASAGISPGGMAYMSGDLFRQGRTIPGILGGLGVGLKIGSDFLSGYARRNRDLYTLAKRQEALRRSQIRDYREAPQYHRNVGYFGEDGGKVKYLNGDTVDGDPPLTPLPNPLLDDNSLLAPPPTTMTGIQNPSNLGTTGTQQEKYNFRNPPPGSQLIQGNKDAQGNVAGDYWLTPDGQKIYEIANVGQGVSFRDGGKYRYENGDIVDGDPPLTKAPTLTSTIPTTTPQLATNVGPMPTIPTMSGIQDPLSLGTTGTQQEKYNFRNPPEGSQLILGQKGVEGAVSRDYWLTPTGEKIYKERRVGEDISFKDGGKYKKKYNLGGLEGDPPFLLDRGDLRQSDPIIQLDTVSNPLQSPQLEDPTQETIPRKIDMRTGELVPNVEMTPAPQLDITAAFNAVDGQLATNVGRAPVTGDTRRRGRRRITGNFRDGGTYLVGDQITIKDPSGKLVTGVIKDIKDGEIYLD